MKTKDIKVNEHYAWTHYPRSNRGRPHRVLILETGVERSVGRYYSKTKRRDGVMVRFLREDGRRLANRNGDTTVVPAEQILHTWDVHLEEKRQRDIAHEESERREMQHEALVAYAKARLALLGIKEGFEDEDYREDWVRTGDGDHLSFHPKALIALLDKLEGAPPFKPVKRNGKLYVNGLVIAEDNDDGHFDHIYAALKEVGPHAAS